MTAQLGAKAYLLRNGCANIKAIKQMYTSFFEYCNVTNKYTIVASLASFLGPLNEENKVTLTELFNDFKIQHKR